MTDSLPIGKLPADLLARLLKRYSVKDPRVLLGPGIGWDCAVIDFGANLLVVKSDPITFATEEIGWYAVQVNANDLATTGAVPRWFMVTLLLPEGKTTPELVETISQQVHHACEEIGVEVVGGHTEITYGLNRPILAGTMLGEVSRETLVTPQGANPGDRVLLTKGVPIEATAILAREFPNRLRDAIGADEIEQAQAFLYNPGISVLREARLALASGRVSAMHDPTEGGLAMALWELAEASGQSLAFDPGAVPVPDLSARICQALELDPLAAIASGALLLTVPETEASHVCRALEKEGIPCAEIGVVAPGPPAVWRVIDKRRELLPRPERDEIARLFVENAEETPD